MQLILNLWLKSIFILKYTLAILKFFTFIFEKKIILTRDITHAKLIV